ncbi:hypothetical protein CQ017_11310 [Arthrobacter sp. MYb224]|nr:hypothetical protein CQ017_11310 [Arthrobacter sp. MYb224]
MASERSAEPRPGGIRWVIRLVPARKSVPLGAMVQLEPEENPALAVPSRLAAQAPALGRSNGPKAFARASLWPLVPPHRVG